MNNQIFMKLATIIGYSSTEWLVADLNHYGHNQFKVTTCTCIFNGCSGFINL